jgi:hypothetical protein
MAITPLQTVLNAQTLSPLSQSDPAAQDGTTVSQFQESIFYSRTTTIESYLYTAQGMLSSIPASSIASAQGTDQAGAAAETNASQPLNLQDYQSSFLDIIKNRVKYLLDAISGAQDSQKSDPVFQLLQSSMDPTSATSASDSSDYWSPEQTAMRIVSFALSFYDGTSDRGEFASMVKDAVSAGYQAAKDAWGGSLPGVADQTISLAMDAIDTFASGNGLDVVA